jgi:hypothetical protein
MPATFYRRSFGSAGGFRGAAAIGFISSDADAALMLLMLSNDFSNGDYSAGL